MQTALTKINGKLKKRAITNNLVGLQQSQNTNPSREKTNDRENSLEPAANYSLAMNAMRGVASKGTRDNSENQRENTFISNQYANASVV
jgi:hypothetical protein